MSLLANKTGIIIMYNTCRLTLEIGKLEVVVMQGQVVLHRGQATGASGQVSDTLVLTVKDLRVMI